MKKLLIGLLTLGSVTTFASGDTCVSIDPFEKNGYIYEEICAEEIDGNTIIFPYLQEEERGGFQKIMVVPRRLKKDASEICLAFGLDNVTKRKHVEKQKLTFNDHGRVAWNNNNGGVDRYIRRITCE